MSVIVAINIHTQPRPSPPIATVLLTPQISFLIIAISNGQPLSYSREKGCNTVDTIKTGGVPFGVAKQDQWNGSG